MAWIAIPKFRTTREMRHQGESEPNGNAATADPKDSIARGNTHIEVLSSGSAIRSNLNCTQQAATLRIRIVIADAAKTSCDFAGEFFKRLQSAKMRSRQAIPNTAAAWSSRR